MTMREVALPFHRTVRCWYGELPAAQFRPIRELRFQFEVRSRPSPPALGAIEVRIPAGGRVIYALLGASYTPLQSDCVLVRVRETDNDGFDAQDRSSGLPGDLRLGLPPEFAAAVMTGASDPVRLARLGPGTLDYQTAAFSLTGSGSTIFEFTSRLVLDVLINRGHLDEVGLAAGLQRALRDKGAGGEEL